MVYIHVYSMNTLCYFQGKCESKGILMGSNAAIMSIEFDLEVRFFVSHLVIFLFISLLN